MPVLRARIEGVEFAIHDAVERHGASAGADHGVQDQAEDFPTGPAPLVTGGHEHGRQGKRQREDRVRKTHESRPFSEPTQDGSWRLEAGGWGAQNGEWRMEDRGWRMVISLRERFGKSRRF